MSGPNMTFSQLNLLTLNQWKEHKGKITEIFSFEITKTVSGRLFFHSLHSYTLVTEQDNKKTEGHDPCWFMSKP